METHDLLILIGLIFNFFGALMIALFSTHGTSTLWRYKLCRKAGYIIFIVGFVIQIFAILFKYMLVT